MKYCLSPQEISWAPPSEFPSGSGNISLYTPPLVTIQLQFHPNIKAMAPYQLFFCGTFHVRDPAAESWSAKHSLPSRMYQSQGKRDWASEVAKIVSNFEINLSNHVIKHMVEVEFKKLTKLQSATFKYLLDKLQSDKQGKNIKYSQFEMSDYLQLIS